jgi:hypothetical protein
MDVVEGAGRKAKRMVLQCINGVSSNPVEGRTKNLTALKSSLIKLGTSQHSGLSIMSIKWLNH